MSKLSKRKCKQCGEVFEKKQPLQFICSVTCAIEYGKKSADKRIKKERKKKRDALKPIVKAKQYTNYLQNEINKLSRKIDEAFGFGCIDCGKSFGNQIDASHFNDVGGNNSIRYNLHNVHAARSHCNQYQGGRKKEYKEGLIKRYNEEYAEYVDTGIKLKYPHIKLSPIEVSEKLAIVRKLNRDFNTFKLEGGIQARDLFNKIIGIYL